MGHPGFVLHPGHPAWGQSAVTVSEWGVSWLFVAEQPDRSTCLCNYLAGELATSSTSDEPGHLTVSFDDDAMDFGQVTDKCDAVGLGAELESDWIFAAGFHRDGGVCVQDHNWLPVHETSLRCRERLGQRRNPILPRN